MHASAELEPVLEATPELGRVTDLFGGPAVLGTAVTGVLEVHELLLRGLPGEALTHLVGAVPTLGTAASLEKAVGMSLRTFQRRRDEPAKPLSPGQSGRAWKFAEILVKAIEVFGSKHEAEEWLERPAMGLDRRRPIDLLGTPAGVEAVETFLLRLKYGVYM